MCMYGRDDIVYLLDDVTYDDKLLKRGQELFVSNQERNRVECYIDGSDYIYVFSSEFLTDNPSDVLWSKAFFRVLLDNISLCLGVGLAIIVLIHFIASS